MRARTRTALVVAPVVGVGAAALVRLLRGAPSPAFTTPPTVPRLVPDRREPASPPTAPVASAPAEATTSTSEPVATDAPAEPADRTWVLPVEGACPEGYEIKVKIRSGIYHRPGMFAYNRTVPDRCYATPEDAQADGFRPAKR